jgi:hypothetical protein
MTRIRPHFWNREGSCSLPRCVPTLRHDYELVNHISLNFLWVRIPKTLPRTFTFRSVCCSRATRYRLGFRSILREVRTRLAMQLSPKNRAHCGIVSLGWAIYPEADISKRRSEIVKLGAARLSKDSTTSPNRRFKPLLPIMRLINIRT